MRDIARRTSPGAAVEAQLGELWFELHTGRIDAMKHVETRLEQDLLQQCRQSIERIRKDLQSHRKLLDGIADMHAAAEQAKLFSVQASDLDTPPPDGMTAMVARSTLELLLTQSVRLQGLNEELREARQALDERKQVERAKQQLMRQQAARKAGLRPAASGSNEPGPAPGGSRPAPAGIGRFGEHGRTRPALPALKTGTPCRPGARPAPRLCSDPQASLPIQLVDGGDPPPQRAGLAPRLREPSA